MRPALIAALVAVGCAPATDRTLVLDRAAVGLATSGAEEHVAPCAPDGASAGARWTFRAPRDGRYLVRADVWVGGLALTVRDPAGEVLGCTRGGASAALALDLHAEDDVVVYVGGLDDDASHRVAVREIVPWDASASPPPSPPDPAPLRALSTHAAPLQPGVTSVVIAADAPAFAPACGAATTLSGGALHVRLAAESALEVHANADVLELRRADDVLGLVACSAGGARTIRRRLPAGDYLLVVGVSAADTPVEVTAEATITELPPDARAP